MLRPALFLTFFFVIVTGLAFPAVMTGLAKVLFPRQASGSLVVENGTVVGSELIGQNFAKPQYFHPRPSAAGNGYDAANSSGTNLGPTNDKLLNGLPDGSFAGAKQLAEAYRKENGLAPATLLPSDAVTRSASGLDPDISVANALLQAPRVAKARGLDEAQVKALIQTHTHAPLAGFIGDAAVNVLSLNQALDQTK